MIHKMHARRFPDGHGGVHVPRVVLPAALVATAAFRMARATVLGGFEESWFSQIQGSRVEIGGQVVFSLQVKCSDSAEDLERMDCKRCVQCLWGAASRMPGGIAHIHVCAALLL